MIKCSYDIVPQLHHNFTLHTYIFQSLFSASAAYSYHIESNKSPLGLFLENDSFFFFQRILDGC